MLTDRGYDTGHESWIMDDNVNGDQWKKKLTKKHGAYPIRKLMISEYTKSDCKNVVVFFVGLEGSKQIKVDSVKPFINKITQDNKDGILVINSTLSAEAKKQLQYITQCDYQIFQEDEFVINIMDHVFQPSFHPVTDDMAVILKTTLGLKPKGLSLLLQSDPVVKYYHFTSGQLIIIKTNYCIDTINDTRYELAVVQ